MPSNLDPPPQPPPPPTGRIDRRALLQAYQDVVRETKETPVRRRREGPDRRPYWVTVGVIIAGLLALLILQPPWLFNRPPAEPPQVQEASLRIRMYVEIDRVWRYKQAHGSWPVRLADAGGDSAGLTYERRGEGFILSGANGVSQLRYQSTESPEAFLGSSYQVVRARAQRRAK